MAVRQRKLICLVTMTALLLGLSSLARSTIEPETIGVKELATPSESWLMARAGLGTYYIFDAANGNMHGLIGATAFTPAIEVNLAANEFYAAESYYSRLTNGDRTDVVTIYDVPTLSPKAEIKVPNKIAALPFRHYIALLDDQRFLALFNLTPAQSVTVVDLQQQTFVTELSTPGCALTVPSVERAFLQICGDGKLQLIRLNGEGQEAERVRSQSFFKIDDDPVFDKTAAVPEGWLFISYNGQVFTASVDGSKVSVSKPWSLLDDEQRAADWRPGGGQFFTYHAAQDLLFVLMNSKGGYSHDSAGDEVWIYKRAEQRLLTRLPLPHQGTDLFVTRTAKPLLSVSGTDGQLHVYDVESQKLQRSIAEIGTGAGYLQGVTH